MISTQPNRCLPQEIPPGAITNSPNTTGRPDSHRRIAKGSRASTSTPSTWSANRSSVEDDPYRPSIVICVPSAPVTVTPDSHVPSVSEEVVKFFTTWPSRPHGITVA